MAPNVNSPQIVLRAHGRGQYFWRAMRQRLGIITLIVAALAWIVATWVKPTCLGPQHSSSNFTDAKLTVAYSLFNEQWFNNKLPSSPLVTTRFGLAGGNLGLTSTCPTGLCIEINRALNPADKQVFLTLLHEQCHVKTWGEKEKDGPKWHSCMRTLAVEGAMDDLW